MKFLVYDSALQSEATNWVIINLICKGKSMYKGLNLKFVSRYRIGYSNN
jgi:hypothetical protein